jgi:signal transduction histidine kinase
MSKFKTRARAVDMLGRQQIAGIPNAISELFKNAHDAYADHVEVDYFHSDNLFVLRDDGLGMTIDDFENRWLTIGTESKLPTNKGINLPPIDPSKKKRPIIGEKGIGRLAIAVIGPQVLVLTRSKNNTKSDNLVASFIHWGLFEAPGINLDQIEVPVKTFTGGTLPNKNNIQEMIESVRKNVNTLEKDGFLDLKSARNINKDLDLFNFDLLITAKSLDNPTLLNNGFGTHFYIQPTNENLEIDLESDIEEKEYSKLRKLLIGFSNTMVNSNQISIQTAFRYWPNDEKCVEMIGKNDFFTPEDFDSVDHHIQGNFNDFGQFIGTISVYGKKPENIVIPWQKSLGKPIACGPFKINFGYVQGRQSESKLPPSIHAQINQKLGQLGGLYIYKDNIRVLPYGDFDVDFLGFEKKRSIRASEGFFSFRRMFGSIELSQPDNNALVEKAGREGFQENRAYREFRDLLDNFFVQLAADFFREGGKKAEIWSETKEELKRLGIARKKQEEESRKKRKDFETQLESFFQCINNGEPQRDVNNFLKLLHENIAEAVQIKNGNKLLELELIANHKLADLIAKYKIEWPEGIGIGSLKRDWNSYNLEMDELTKSLFVPVSESISKSIFEAYQTIKKDIDQKQRIESLVNEIVYEKNEYLQSRINSVQTAFSTFQANFQQIINKISGDFNSTILEINNNISELETDKLNRKEIESYRYKWENQVNYQAKQFTEVLSHLEAQISDINFSRDKNGFLISNNEITAALEDEVLTLRDQADANLVLAQLGMAIEIINHEFSNTIKTIRSSILQLKSWAEINPNLLPVYTDIFNSFTHLDGYLAMFTPLNRRLYRNPIEIKGSNIAKYLNDLFRERFERHDIELITTQDFRDMTITGFPSTFFPVFINLVDNSIFWLKDRPTPRKIKLDARNNSFIISDNGPGVPNRDKEAIFELGFSRKPSGRGMGLYISQEILKKENYKLLLADNESTGGATFIIKRLNQKSNGE